MIKLSKRIKTKEVLEILGVGKQKLREMETEGILIPIEKTSRSKYFKLSDVEKLIGKNDNKDRKVIVYYRVSSSSQKKELSNQLSYIESYVAANGIKVDEYIKDIGSGINYNNKGLNRMITDVINGNVDKIIISHKDRLLRFGYEMFENICKLKGTEIEVINLKTTSPQEELVEDLMTIIHVFSARLYGLRSYSKKIKKVIEEEKDESI